MSTPTPQSTPPTGNTTEKEAKKQRKEPEKTPLAVLPLRHRFMFNNVFKNKELLKLFLESLLGIQIESIDVYGIQDVEATDANGSSAASAGTERIVSVQTEKTVEDLYGFKAVRFDVHVVGTSKIFSIEMQATDRPDYPIPQRGRSYQIGLDRSLREGEPYTAIRDFYVIFVCDYEPSKSDNNGYAKYTRVSTFKENNESAEDGYHLIVLNTHYENDEKHKNVPPDMLELLDYIRTANDAMTCQGDLAKLAIQGVLDTRKDPKKEGEYMQFWTLTWDEQLALRSEAKKEGVDLYDSCVKLVKAGYSDQEIADKLGEDISEIQETINRARALYALISQV